MSVPTRKYLILWIALTLFAVSAHAQDAASAHDQALDQLDKAKEAYSYSNDEEAISFGLLGLDQAIASGDPNLMIDFKSLLGEVYLSQEDHKKAIFYFLDATTQAEDIRNNLLEANGRYSLGNAYAAMGAYEKAIESYTKGFSLYEREQNAIGKLNAMFAIGNSYLNANIVPKALEAYEVQLQLARDINNRLMENRALGLLMQVHERMGNLERASQFGEEQFAVVDPRLKAPKAYSLAELFLKIGDNKKANEYAGEAITIDNRNPEYHYMKAKASLGLGQTIAAQNEINRARDGFLSRNDALGEIKVDLIMGGIELERGNLKESENYLKKAERSLEIRSTNVLQKDLYTSMISLYNESKQTELANDYRNRLSSLNTSQARIDNSSKIDPTLEVLAQQYEDDALIQIEKNKNQQLSRQQEQLLTIDEERKVQLLEQQNKLQQQEVARKNLEAERARQQLLITQQQMARTKDQAELDRLQQLAELQRLREEEQKRALQLSENDRLILTQKAKLQASQIEAEEQQKRFLLVILAIGLLFIAGLIILFYRTNKSRKLIAKQNHDLARQQKVIRKANVQLNKAHETMRSALEKEQKTRAQLQDANEELKNTQVQLVQSEKMSSLGQLTAGIAHEINNPINFVFNGVHALQENFQEIVNFVDNYKRICELDDFEKIKKYNEVMKEDEDVLDQLKEGTEELIQDISYGASRVAEIVNGLRTFSRHDEADVKSAHVQEFLESSLLILKNKYKNKVEIIKEIDPDLEPIDCFPGQLNQAFVNLIGNAIDAIEDTGTITLRSKNLDNDHIQIQVIDDGSGMTKEVMDQIFVPFYTTKDVGQGTGLGLAITHGIVEKHNGKITVDSEVGKGTTFTITLPKQLQPETILEEG